MSPQLMNGNVITEPRIRFEDVPFAVLRKKSRQKLSVLLNPEKVLRSEDGYCRDWRGIFSLSGLSQSEYSLISQSSDKIEKLLDLWQKKNQDMKINVSISQLQQCFEAIDRYDVYDDTYHLFSKDAQAYLTEQRSDKNAGSQNFETLKAEPENDIITIQDMINAEKGLPPQNYDAFVIFDDKDIEFATELVERCELNGYSLCLKDRDLLGGFSFESETILRLLKERCNRLIVIVSKAFLRSPMQVFIANNAHALGIEQGKRKIIPCLLEPCELPQMLRYCFRLDYFRNHKLFDFWEKLDKSLKTTVDIKRPISETCESTKLKEIEFSSNNLKTADDSFYDENDKYKFTDTSASTASTPTERKSRMFFFQKKSNPEPEAPIMPPAPKLRGASSMLSVNKSNDQNTTLKSNKLSKSTFYLNEISNEDAILAKSKRKKWYDMFLPPSTHKENNAVMEKCNDTLAPSVKKEKQRWYKRKKKNQKGKPEIVIEC